MQCAAHERVYTSLLNDMPSNIPRHQSSMKCPTTRQCKTLLGQGTCTQSKAKAPRPISKTSMYAWWTASGSCTTRSLLMLLLRNVPSANCHPSRFWSVITSLYMSGGSGFSWIVTLPSGSPHLVRLNLGGKHFLPKMATSFFEGRPFLTNITKFLGHLVFQAPFLVPKRKANLDFLKNPCIRIHKVFLSSTNRGECTMLVSLYATT